MSKHHPRLLPSPMPLLITTWPRFPCVVLDIPPPYGIPDHPSVDRYDSRPREPAGSVNIFELQAKCAPYDGRKSNATLDGLQSDAISAPFLRGELHHEIKPRTRTTQPECFMSPLRNYTPGPSFPLPPSRQLIAVPVFDIEDPTYWPYPPPGSTVAVYHRAHR